MHKGAAATPAGDLQRHSRASTWAITAAARPWEPFCSRLIYIKTRSCFGLHSLVLAQCGLRRLRQLSHSAWRYSLSECATKIESLYDRMTGCPQRAEQCCPDCRGPEAAATAAGFRLASSPTSGCQWFTRGRRSTTGGSRADSPRRHGGWGRGIIRGWRCRCLRTSILGVSHEPTWHLYRLLLNLWALSSRNTALHLHRTQHSPCMTWGCLHLAARG